MDNNVDTIIGLNVNVKGNIKNKGSIQINGTVEGEVKSDENINVGETAIVKGPVIAKTIEISGTVKGTIEATEKLELNPTAKVIGDINVKSLIIKQGAAFIGKSAMPQQGEALAEAEKETASKPKEGEPKAEAEKEVKEEKVEDRYGFFSKK